MAIAVLVLLVVFAAIHHEAVWVVGMSLFGGALVLYYAVKVLHVWTDWKTDKVQHAALYLLVACTYTAVALVLPQRGWGWSIFGVAWGLSVIASVFRVPMAVIYAAFFILDLVSFSVVHAFLDSEAKWFFGLGGAAYILASFLDWRGRRESIFASLVGSTAHFWAMLWMIFHQ